MQTVCLVGCPNCGKSTLFNRLTHSRVHTGNRAGVTVELTEGIMKYGGEELCVVDLPGIYSLSSHTDDEEVTLSFLESGDADIIVNVINSCELLRQLRLSCEIMRAYPGKKIIFALNMSDEVKKQGGEIRAERLCELTGGEAVGISAYRGDGVDDLCGKIVCSARSTDSSGEKERSVRKQELQIEGKQADSRAKAGEKALHGEPLMTAERLYSQICVREPSSKNGSMAADRVLASHKYGIPIFFAVAALIFYISFGAPSDFLTELFEKMTLRPLTDLCTRLLDSFSVSRSVHSLVIDGVIGGISAVLSFLPRIFILFILLSMLEDSGYMARISFLMDMPLRACGVSGRCFVPLMLGLGCSVTAVMAARNLSGKRERYLCRLLVPLIPCSARVPVCMLICTAFLGKIGWAVGFFIYMLGFVSFFVLTFIIRKCLQSGEKEPLFVTELPPYRLPSFRNMLAVSLLRVRHFLLRAGSVIFLTSVVLWLMLNFSPDLSPARLGEDSILYRLSGIICPIFSPLGFGNPQAVSALLSGLGAKESIISALSVLLAGMGDISDGLVSSGVFTKCSAISFALFSSMYIPCGATLGVQKNELGTFRNVAFSVLLHFTAAYLLSFSVYKLAGCFFL